MGGMLDHVSIQCADLAASAAFYDAVLAPLGGQRVLDFGEAIGYGVPPRPDFWLGGSDHRGRLPRVAPRLHRAGPRGGARLLRGRYAPVVRRSCTSRRYGRNTTPDYYGAFVRDPDGNNVEAVCHQPG